jgi:hypothetical protein
MRPPRIDAPQRLCRAHRRPSVHGGALPARPSRRVRRAPAQALRPHLGRPRQLPSPELADQRRSRWWRRAGPEARPESVATASRGPRWRGASAGTPYIWNRWLPARTVTTRLLASRSISWPAACAKKPRRRRTPSSAPPSGVPVRAMSFKPLKSRQRSSQLARPQTPQTILRSPRCSS